MTLATINTRNVAGRVRADARLLAGLRQRDGPVPQRPNGHGDTETCPYVRFYNDGECPWCSQANASHLERRRISRLRRHRAA